MIVRVLHVDGTLVAHTIDDADPMPAIHKLIDCDCVDFVRLADRVHVMLVDDNGIAKGRPVNPNATVLYHDVCRPGTTHQICGDVAIVRAADLT